jgi:hypothetical protein
MALGEAPLPEGRGMSAIESCGCPLVFKAGAPDIDAVERTCFLHASMRGAFPPASSPS